MSEPFGNPEQLDATLGGRLRWPWYTTPGGAVIDLRHVLAAWPVLRRKGAGDSSEFHLTLGSAKEDDLVWCGPFESFELAGAERAAVLAELTKPRVVQLARGGQMGATVALLSDGRMMETGYYDNKWHPFPEIPEVP